MSIAQNLWKKHLGADNVTTFPTPPHQEAIIHEAEVVTVEPPAPALTPEIVAPVPAVRAAAQVVAQINEQLGNTVLTLAQKVHEAASAAVPTPEGILEAAADLNDGMVYIGEILLASRSLELRASSIDTQIMSEQAKQGQLEDDRLIVEATRPKRIAAAIAASTHKALLEVAHADRSIGALTTVQELPADVVARARAIVGDVLGGLTKPTPNNTWRPLVAARLYDYETMNVSRADAADRTTKDIASRLQSNTAPTMDEALNTLEALEQLKVADAARRKAADKLERARIHERMTNSLLPQEGDFDHVV